MPTTDEVVRDLDLTGRTALVTGVSAGLGVETARALTSVGARVLGAARDLGKAKAALDGLDVELVELDLADLASVRACAETVLELAPSLNVLVNNAGVMAPPLLRTAQGFELQLGTNHLGHFLLTRLLEPALVAGAPARVVNVSSRGHLRAGLDLDDPHWHTRPYDKWKAYGQSKTANVLFTVELERRWGPAGVHAYALHPGVIMTELSRHLTEADLAALSSGARPGGGQLTLVDVPTGAATQVWAATTPELEGRGGLYLEDCAIAGPTPGDGSAGYAPWAVDPEVARRLWEWSEREVGLV
ncbi:MAG: SDR family NAD(P)-dependent oxidoreductase [Frankiales bacterium]|nr:MAG: SDR family NAD(P)-dependent oxidoreductase [Frankiales bacterium]